MTITLRNHAKLPQPRLARILSMKNFAYRDRMLKLPESRRIAMKVLQRLPPNSASEVPGRPVRMRMRKLLTPAVVLDRTQLGRSLSSDQMEEPKDIVGKAEGRRGRRQRELLRNLYPEKCNQRQIKLKARRARRSNRVHSELLKSASVEAMPGKWQ